MKHQSFLFLDLEDTIITPVPNGWGDFEIINLQKIKRLIDQINPTFVSVFSFAVHNERERDLFNSICRPHVERALGITFSAVPTVDEMIISCSKLLGLAASTVDFSDVITMWGKQETFRMFVRQSFGKNVDHGFSTSVFLIDDVVQNEFFEFPNLKLSGSILNVDNLPEQFQ